MRSVARMFVAAAFVFGITMFASATAAFAQSANLDVSASVSNECTISTTALDFGTYSTLSGSADDNEGVVTLTCTEGADPFLAMDLGLNASGSTRRMSGGGDFIEYEVYQDAARTTVWGSAGADRLDPDPAPSNAARNFDAYGRITAGQSVPAAAYSDTLVVTVEF